MTYYRPQRELHEVRLDQHGWHGCRSCYYYYRLIIEAARVTHNLYWLGGRPNCHGHCELFYSWRVSGPALQAQLQLLRAIASHILLPFLTAPRSHGIKS